MDYSPSSREDLHQPQVELRDDELSHIRGVQTAPKEEQAGTESSEVVQAALAKVIPLFSRQGQTYGKLQQALFDRDELKEYIGKGSTQRAVRELWQKLELGPMTSENNDSMAASLGWYKNFVGALIRRIHVANDDASENSQLMIMPPDFRQSTLMVHVSFWRLFRDLSKLYYLLKACERVAISNGC
ncbi:MAG: hypothetical protein U0519_02895 [Candidatus Gracilibacteria bacterium]